MDVKLIISPNGIHRRPLGVNGNDRRVEKNVEYNEKLYDLRLTNYR
jgi:hypothetical protein